MNLIDLGGHFIQPHKMLTKSNNNHRMAFFVTIRDRCGVNAAANRRSRQYESMGTASDWSRYSVRCYVNFWSRSDYFETIILPSTFSAAYRAQAHLTRGQRDMRRTCFHFYCCWLWTHCWIIVGMRSKTPLYIYVGSVDLWFSTVCGMRAPTSS